jgi:hypothetical protein
VISAFFEKKNTTDLLFFNIAYRCKYKMWHAHFGRNQLWNSISNCLTYLIFIYLSYVLFSSGRRLTSQGRRDLDRIAAQIKSKKTSDMWSVNKWKKTLKRFIVYLVHSCMFRSIVPYKRKKTTKSEIAGFEIRYGLWKLKDTMFTKQWIVLLCVFGFSLVNFNNTKEFWRIDPFYTKDF